MLGAMKKVGYFLFVVHISLHLNSGQVVMTMDRLKEECNLPGDQMSAKILSCGGGLGTFERILFSGMESVV